MAAANAAEDQISIYCICTLDDGEYDLSLELARGWAKGPKDVVCT